MIKVSKDECGDEVSENLGAHVEGPEKCKIKSFVWFDGAVRDVGAGGRLAHSFSQAIQKGGQEDDEIDEAVGEPEGIWIHI